MLGDDFEVEILYVVGRREIDRIELRRSGEVELVLKSGCSQKRLLGNGVIDRQGIKTDAPLRLLSHSVDASVDVVTSVGENVDNGGAGISGSAGVGSGADISNNANIDAQKGLLGGNAIDQLRLLGSVRRRIDEKNLRVGVGFVGAIRSEEGDETFG